MDQIPTHGGSLRIYAKHQEDNSKEISDNVKTVLELEASKGVNRLDYYNGFQEKAFKVKSDLLLFLITQKNSGKKVAAYGAAAKGNTMMNYCGVKADLIDFVVDANPHKQNKFLPASHIPVMNEEYLKVAKPDYVIILPWNLKKEITQQLSYIRGWGGQFAVPIPAVQIF